MRGTLLIIVLIAMLVVGVLVMKNYTSRDKAGAGAGSGVRETVQKAEDAADAANKAVDKMKIPGN